MILLKTLAILIVVNFTSAFPPEHHIEKTTVTWKNSSNKNESVLKSIPVIKFEKVQEKNIKTIEPKKLEHNLSTSGAPRGNQPRDFVNNVNDEQLQSGALLRGFYVILGITVILIGYIGFKVLRKGRVSNPTRVRKYGILANRSDVEMLPLPLSDDEDDETVFDLNNQMK